MIYTPPIGDNVQIVFNGPEYTPPVSPDSLNLLFVFRPVYDETCDETVGLYSNHYILNHLFPILLDDIVNNDLSDFRISNFPINVDSVCIAGINKNLGELIGFITEAILFEEISIGYIPTGIIQILLKPYALSEIFEAIINVSFSPSEGIDISEINVENVTLKDINEKITIQEIM